MDRNLNNPSFSYLETRRGPSFVLIWYQRVASCQRRKRRRGPIVRVLLILKPNAGVFLEEGVSGIFKDLSHLHFQTTHAAGKETYIQSCTSHRRSEETCFLCKSFFSSEDKSPCSPTRPCRLFRTLSFFCFFQRQTKSKRSHVRWQKEKTKQRDNLKAENRRDSFFFKETRHCLLSAPRLSWI